MHKVGGHVLNNELRQYCGLQKVPWNVSHLSYDGTCSVMEIKYTLIRNIHNTHKHIKAGKYSNLKTNYPVIH